MRNVLRFLKKLVLSALGRELFFRRELTPSTEFHGSAYGGWAILAHSLTADARVVSAGVGKDASFDLSLIRKYGCVVHAYDPTPIAVQWVAENVRDTRFVLHPFALSDSDGVLELYPPKNPEGDSASCVRYEYTAAIPIKVPALSLRSILQELNFDRVDVLKLDIEGAEYRVIHQALADGALDRVGQFLVEFHHAFPAFGLSATRRANGALQAAGWKIAWVSRSHHEILYIKRAAADRWGRAVRGPGRPGAGRP